MFGGLAVNDGFDSASLTGRNSANLVCPRGDNTKARARPKFAHYSPNHLLTGLSWDHADVYPTENHTWTHLTATATNAERRNGGGVRG